ncbi:hypothetical protein [Natranaerofaba carboxydovora]|uniref:hypothetical protein n=1 Tax=Natranaerofaba carboxydovora TaxID=2742683 RepID=UPI001F12E1FF|nr:hypothetical protein [Natranaerofaba carboxydovora]
MRVITRKRMDWDTFLEEIVLKVKRTSLPKVVWKDRKHVSFEEVEDFILGTRNKKWMVVYYDCMIKAKPYNLSKIVVEIWF